MRRRKDINGRSNANRLLFACLEDLVIALKVRVGKMPEGRFKEFLMTIYFRFYHNPLYRLNSILNRAQLLQDGSLFVQLGDGTEFYGLQDRRSVPQIKYGDRRKLGKIKDFLLFGSFFCVLANQYVERGYDRYHTFTKGECVVDIGAHLGIFTVKAAKAVGERGRIIAIEPDPGNLKLLERNIKVNGLKNVTIIPEAVGAKKDSLRLYLSEETWSHSLLAEQAGSNEFIEVEVDTLDNILRWLNVQGVALIKMNVEGAEIEALKGMHETLTHTAELVIAANHVVNGEMASHTIAWQLKQAGFEVLRYGGEVYATKKGSIVTS